MRSPAVIPPPKKKSPMKQNLRSCRLSLSDAKIAKDVIQNIVCIHLT